MLFQYVIQIDVACHRYTLNMQVPGALHIKFRRESDCKLNLDSSENMTQDHCCGINNACSLLQVNRMRQRVSVSGTDLTGLRAYRPMGPKRQYTVCLETVIPVAEES
ncbi:uncharacterized protein TNCV_4917731 [Trichonephila clavipes]|nr:uncharacterized protein TNCV_4917731 [Trichonephila clavipes]